MNTRDASLYSRRFKYNDRGRQGAGGEGGGGVGGEGGRTAAFAEVHYGVRELLASPQR